MSEAHQKSALPLENITDPALLQKLRGLQQQSRRPKPVEAEIELATAVVLVEVAASDERITKIELAIVHAGLKNLFGISDEAVAALIAQAKNSIRSLRSSGSFAELLREHLDAPSKKLVGKIIDDLISCDGAIQGFEGFLRQRFRSMLGLPDEASKLENATKDS